MAGCGCGKKSQPTGFGTSIQDAQRQGGKEIQEGERKGSGRSVSFELKQGDRVRSFGSEIERRAEQRRRGGTLI